MEVGLRAKALIRYLHKNLHTEQAGSQMTEDETQEKAVAFLALLKKDEEALVTEVKKLVKSNKELAKYIFSAQIDGWTLFHACALRGCRKLLKYAIRSGVDVNLKMGEPEGVPGGCSALHMAAHRGDVSVIEILTTSRADLDPKDSNGKTPVFYASRAHNSLAVKTLRKLGADISNCENAVIRDEGSLRSPLNNFRFLPFPGCSGSRS
ncbi:serine/threonine-protein phosphatase 6 regulatory ankyrin repeat subunit B-like isoform X2 [Saccostrea echinata]|uniref:serine/threonine-protein phosphatase 6 regulatory ankyrin repeat subunit B-like isoform X2 n=1 Tax=Saccostrea echinata TaxID=191078 RepID=UPI002A82DAFA|nr:serine/threonine-protein phosphatase 6 regulatory ankyrin repeat subunit B-like isoform X2 [Saccostrea echinata]